ncbi:hypothetical protein HYFRA_00006742 [Hymenoscyphus fraxineus]|uniref:Uncharacterized protein n=1 Tax=Hymenoscyphus fraxineus TaxID=746836 RepID=A0A9N9KTY2_9HELO|nr:hypothetical protein HYFRA_00006742 [Hymenoscyphus fraxineus]
MGLGVVAVPRPRAKSYNDFVRPRKISPPSSSSSFPKTPRRVSIPSVFQLRLQKDLPLRLQRKSKMSQPPSPPSSPKRSHPGGDDRQPKKPKTDKDLPARFEGLKPNVKPFTEKVPSLAGMKRLFEPEADENDFYARRSKLVKLDHSNAHPLTNKVRTSDRIAMIKRKRSLALTLKNDVSKMPAAAQDGLKNFTGAICYRISLVQALVHIPQFVNWLHDYHTPDNCVVDDPTNCFACVFRKFLVPPPPPQTTGLEP